MTGMVLVLIGYIHDEGRVYFFGALLDINIVYNFVCYVKHIFPLFAIPKIIGQILYAYPVLQSRSFAFQKLFTLRRMLNEKPFLYCYDAPGFTGFPDW